VSSTFISYSHRDRYFVSLLVAILDHHDIHAWCDTRDIPIGSRYPGVIDGGLGDADSLLVVVSANSAESKAVTGEIAAFRAIKSNAPIIPLLLDATDPNRLLHGTSEFQRIDFTVDMNAAFVALLSHFGKEFLPAIEKRSNNRRGARYDRRAGDRSSQLVARMWRIFWKAYQAETRMGEFQEVRLGVRQYVKLEDSLENEIKLYLFRNRDTGESVPPKVALRAAVVALKTEWAAKSAVQAVYLIEAVAETLESLYLIERPGRRKPPASRRLADERRVEPRVSREPGRSSKPAPRSPHGRRDDKLASSVRENLADR
jgi:hypothetical protein